MSYDVCSYAYCHEPAVARDGRGHLVCRRHSVDVLNLTRDAKEKVYTGSRLNKKRVPELPKEPKPSIEEQIRQRRHAKRKKKC